MQRGASARAASAEPLSQTDEQVVELAHLLQQFPGSRALARNDVGVVIRRDQRHATLLRQLARQGLAVLGEAVIQDDLAAIATGGIDLGLRCITRHHDQRGNAERAS